MTRALILGAGGGLGHTLAARAARRSWSVTRAGRADCDVTDARCVERALDEAEPDVVFLCAAYNAVDLAEDEPEVARAVNAEAPGSIARACARRGVFLLHYSTDFVFDGRVREPYDEAASPNPLGVYGRSKLDGERAVLDSGARAAVARTAWLYGATGRNFPSRMPELLRAGKRLQLDAQRIGSPTSYLQLAEQSLVIAERRIDGLLHAVCSGAVTWLHVAQRVAAAVGASDEQLERVTTAQLQLAAPRPVYSALDCARLRKHDALVMKPWDAALAERLAELEARP